MYCGERAGSTEHIFPSWMMELLATDPRGFPQPIRMTLEDQGSGEVVRRTVGKVKPKLTVEFTTKVCSTCNNGWMNRIDEATRPHFDAIIAGRPTPLDASAQASLAAWVTKTTLTGRAAHSP